MTPLAFEVNSDEKRRWSEVFEPIVTRTNKNLQIGSTHDHRKYLD